jgi:hypothetical protein
MFSLKAFLLPPNARNHLQSGQSVTRDWQSAGRFVRCIAMLGGLNFLSPPIASELLIKHSQGRAE